MTFYKCETCGNIIVYANNSGVPVFCCGEKMKPIESSVGSTEKHIPMITYNKNEVVVSVSTISHPMTEEHYIAWIALETSKGVTVKYVREQDIARARFEIEDGEEIVAAYAYCNLHGLWSTDI